MANYYIVAVIDGNELLGSSNAAIVRDAKTIIKVNNRLRSFNPPKYDEIRVYRYTNIYDEKTYSLVKTIKNPAKDGNTNS